LSSLSLAIIFYFFKLALLLVIFAITIPLGLLKDFRKRQLKALFFNDLLVLVVEGYLEFLICGYLNLQDYLLFDQNTFTERLSLLLSLFCLSTATILPILMILLLAVCPVDFFSKPFFDSHFTVLTEGVKKKSKATLSYFLMFMVRRLLYATIAFSLSSFPCLQVIGLLLTTMLMQIYQGMYSPRELRELNRIELFNEYFVFLVSMQLYLFFNSYMDN